MFAALIFSIFVLLTEEQWEEVAETYNISPLYAWAIVCILLMVLEE